VRAPGSSLGWLLLWSALIAACSDSAHPKASAPEAATASAPHAAVPAATASGDRRASRPLPAFDGRDLDGAAWSTSALLGKRTLLFGFDPSDPTAATVARALARIAGDRASQNFEIVGVAAAADPAAARSLLAQAGLAVRSFSDPASTLARRIGVQGRVWLVLTDSDGNLTFGEEYFPEEGSDPVAAIETVLRDQLRLPGRSDARFGERPLAPDFTGERLEGGERFRLASLRGKPAIVVFFLHTCPHCHEALRFLKQALGELPEAVRPPLIGISVMNRTWSVQQALKEQGIDFFPVLLDPDASIRSAYGALQGVPVVVLIDGEGRIVSRTEGWSGDRDAALVRMWLAKLTGQRVPMLLSKTGYSGNEVCGVCHESETATWELTNHASAYDTLVRHGVDQKAECVSCHVVGYGKAGGFQIARPDPGLENVGCETCHGRGGPHLSPEPTPAPTHAFEAACLGCHNPVHSLGFDYASFLPRVSHAANLASLALPEAEREKLVSERRAPRKNLLPTASRYVGSEACRSCHADEYAAWSQQPHAHALASLAAKSATGKTDCLQCHTTGFGRPGGFAAGGGEPAVAAVGCESCHGPGGDHVADGARKQGTIVKLSDKCGSCVILQVCSTCHDEANDPGFEFQVKQKILRQRHGKEKLEFESETSAGLPRSAELGLLERALGSRPEGGA